MRPFKFFFFCGRNQSQLKVGNSLDILDNKLFQKCKEISKVLHRKKTNNVDGESNE